MKFKLSVNVFKDTKGNSILRQTTLDNADYHLIVDLNENVEPLSNIELYLAPFHNWYEKGCPQCCSKDFSKIDEDKPFFHCSECHYEEHV